MAAEACIQRFPSHKDCDSLLTALQIRMLAMRQFKPENLETMNPWAGVEDEDCLNETAQVDWWFALGLFYMEQADFESSAAAFDEAIGLAKWGQHVGKAQIMKAICLSELGHHEAAVELCRSANSHWDDGAIPTLYGLNMAHVLQAAGWHHTALNWLIHSLRRERKAPTLEVPGLKSALAEATLLGAFHSNRCDVAIWASDALDLDDIHWKRFEKNGVKHWMFKDCRMAFPGLAGGMPEAELGRPGKRNFVKDSSVAVLGHVASPFYSSPVPGLLLLPICLILAGAFIRWTRRGEKEVTLNSLFHQMQTLLAEGQNRDELLSCLSQIERKLPKVSLDKLGDESSLEELTEREVEVLELAMSGMLPKEIASELGLSPKYIYNIFSELRKKLSLNQDQSLTDLNVQESLAQP